MSRYTSRRSFSGIAGRSARAAAAPAAGEDGAEMSVTLVPGDLLYIPPSWFHEVLTINASISVNVWSDEGDGEAVEPLFRKRPPVDQDQNQNFVFLTKFHIMGYWFAL